MSLVHNGPLPANFIDDRSGVSAPEGIHREKLEVYLEPTAVETAVGTVPAGAAIRSVQTNVEVLLVAGGTSVTLSIGTAADPDKYGTHSADSLAKDQKISTIPAWAVLAAAEPIVITAAATGGNADGDTAFSAGKVRCVVIYDDINDLHNVSPV